MYTCLLEGKISLAYIIKLYCSIRLDKKMRLLIVEFPTHSVLSILGLQNTLFAKLEGMRAVHVWDFSLHGNCFISSNKLAFSTFLFHTASSHGAGFVLKFMSNSTKCKVDKAQIMFLWCSACVATWNILAQAVIYQEIFIFESCNQSYSQQIRF